MPLDVLRAHGACIIESRSLSGLAEREMEAAERRARREHNNGVTCILFHAHV